MKNAHLYEPYDIETEQGLTSRRPMEAMINIAVLASGETCPRCGHLGKLFFGDPDGEHWCAACQVEKDFGLTESAEKQP